MALEKTIKTVHGFTATDAYHRVSNVSIKGKTTMSFSVKSYNGRPVADFEVGMPEFSSQDYECAYDIAGENPIKQAYEHLKTLPEFAGSADV